MAAEPVKPATKPVIEIKPVKVEIVVSGDGRVQSRDPKITIRRKQN